MAPFIVQSTGRAIGMSLTSLRLAEIMDGQRLKELAVAQRRMPFVTSLMLKSL